MRGAPPLVVLALASAAERAGCPRDRSPLGRAAKPHLDRLAREGRVLSVRLARDEEDAASPAPLLALLGIDPERPEARACSRASLLAARAPAPGPGEGYASAEFVSLFRDLLADAEPAGLTPGETELLLEALREPFRRAGARLVAGEGGRLLALGPRALFDPRTPPPDALLHRLSREALDGHEVNAVRRDLGRNGADMVWVSGPGAPAALPEPDPRRGPASAAGEDALFQGACRAAGLAWRDTAPGDAASALAAAEAALATDRVLFLHWRRGLRDALQRDLAARAEGLGELDRAWVGPLAERVAAAGGRLLVLPDLARDTATGRPLPDPVPALLWGAGVQAIGGRRFDE